MQEIKTFVVTVALTCGVAAALAVVGALIYTLSPYALLVGWIITAAIVAAAVGCSVRFLLLPILNGTADIGIKLLDKWADTRIKLSQHETERYLSLSRVPADDNGNRPALIGIDPYNVLSLPTGQYKEHPNLTSLHMHNATPRQIEAPKQEEEEGKDAIEKVIHYEDIAREIPDELSLLGIHPASGHFEIVAPDRYKTAWFVGGSNTGKTNTVYGKVADAVRWGAKLIICDPHAHKSDSLTNKLKDFHYALLQPIAQSDGEIYKAITFFLNEFQNRRDRGASCSQKIVIVVDEVNGLARHPVKIEGKEGKMQTLLQELAETCGYEARGFEMFGFFISQKVAGLSWLRNAMMTVFVHGLLMDSEALLAANNDRKLAQMVRGFKTGRTLVYGYEFEPTILQQPLYGKPKEDHPGAFPDPSILPSETPSLSPSVVPSISSSTDSTIPKDDKLMERAFAGDTLKLKKVVEMLQQEKTQQDIICEVWNVKPNSRAFNNALAEYRKMLAFLAEENEVD
jgi:hypothetical protein